MLRDSALENHRMVHNEERKRSKVNVNTTDLPNVEEIWMIIHLCQMIDFWKGK
jgi:hypothetical protein